MLYHHDWPMILTYCKCITKKLTDEILVKQRNLQMKLKLTFVKSKNFYKGILAIVAFNVLALTPLRQAVACCALGDGPWHVRANGLPIGRVFATRNFGIPSLWQEIFERKANWNWLGPNVIWQVEIDSLTLGSKPICNQTVAGNKYLACQVTTVENSNTKPPTVGVVSRPENNTVVSANSYHAAGKYAIEANMGTFVRRAVYFTQINPNATFRRKEVICAEKGFAWPEFKQGGAPSTSWIIRYSSNETAQSKCPANMPVRYEWDTDLSR